MINKKQFFAHMTAAEYRELVGISKPTIQKQSKYNNQKVEVDGVVFDSKHEGKDWKNLCTMEAAGLITNLRRQVPFVLQAGYKNNQGKAIRPIIYVADFVYERDGTIYVQDSKGVRTDVFKIKRKMFEYKYPDIIFVES